MTDEVFHYRKLRIYKTLPQHKLWRMIWFVLFQICKEQEHSIRLRQQRRQVQRYYFALQISTNLVVGNFPWVEIDQMSQEYRKQKAEHWAANMLQVISWLVWCARQKQSSFLARQTIGSGDPWGRKVVVANESCGYEGHLDTKKPRACGMLPACLVFYIISGDWITLSSDCVSTDSYALLIRCQIFPSRSAQPRQTTCKRMGKAIANDGCTLADTYLLVLANRFPCRS